LRTRTRSSTPRPGERPRKKKTKFAKLCDRMFEGGWSHGGPLAQARPLEKLPSVLWGSCRKKKMLPPLVTWVWHSKETNKAKCGGEPGALQEKQPDKRKTSAGGCPVPFVQGVLVAQASGERKAVRQRGEGHSRGRPPKNYGTNVNGPEGPD